MPESLLFIDDNPAERHIVSEQIKGVTSPNIGESHRYIQNLDRGGYFETTYMSSDDAKRNEMYRENAERRRLESSFTDYHEYLLSLDMKGVIKPFEPIYWQRIAQLSNKSNQFNLTTRRYKENKIEVISQDDENYITLYLSCRSQPLYAELEQICRVFDNVGFKGLISNFIGYENSLNIEWWFVSTFVFTLIVGFLYSHYSKNLGFLFELFLLFCFGVILVYLLPEFEMITILKPLVSSRIYKIIIPYDHGICECCFFSGMIFAKYDKLNELLNAFKGIRKPIMYGLCLLIWMIIVASRDVILPRCFDIITVPVTCAVLKLFVGNTEVINKGLQIIGDNSIWIWLTHSFYCYYFYFAVRIVFISKSLWLDLVILLILSTATAIVLGYVRKAADFVINRFALVQG